MRMVRALSLTWLALLAASPALAQISDGIVKNGVLNDQSSLYADLAGSRSRSSSPTTRTSPTWAPRSPASGTTPTGST